MADNVLITHNSDVFGVVHRLVRMVKEMLKSQSSGVNQIITFDVARLRSYVAELKSFQATVRGIPLLDCPESHPGTWTLPVKPEIPVIENVNIMDILNVLDIAYQEMANCQSSRLATNLIPADSDRLTSYLDRVLVLLTHASQQTPLDLPESSPSEPMTGSGSIGV